MMHGRLSKLVILLFSVFLGSLLGVAEAHPIQPWNNPYPYQPLNSNTLYSAFAEQPKHLDPVRSYSSGEWTFIGQIYEPPLQYHYLKRPYKLIPLAAAKMPDIKTIQKNNQTYTQYTISLQPNMYYQPHPAFADYFKLSEGDVESIYEIGDFEQTGTREVLAKDFVLQIKRLAHPKNHSPIYGFMQNYIVGLADLHQKYIDDKIPVIAVDDLPLAGVTVIDNYTYSILIKDQYPQFIYWLAMPFFAPMPLEALKFYEQAVLKARNINLNWYPVGSGPYMLTENNPQSKMVLKKNPNFHGEVYPSEGSATDKAKGLLVDQGRPLPFVDEIIFSLEKESIPYWNKFLQGYYDTSGISSDSFDNAIDITPDGGLGVSQSLEQKKIRLDTTVSPSIMYWGFNMLDDIVGGQSERARKLRQAISIAFDVDEFITIFANGRGQNAIGPIPPGIFGYDAVTSNPYTQKSLSAAKQLLAEAGYPNGFDQVNNERLTLYFDTMSTGDPDEKSVYAWLQKQFAKLNIELVIRSTDYNRFQDKVRRGAVQLFFWGWNADYPDPENFLFLFYGPNGKVKYKGENAVNYANAQFDSLFEAMKNLPDSPARMDIIQQMVEILQKDAPWIFGYHRQSFQLFHHWNRITKNNSMSRNTLKYARIDADARAQFQVKFNQPLIWPLFALLFIACLMVAPACFTYYQREWKETLR